MASELHIEGSHLALVDLAELVEPDADGLTHGLHEDLRFLHLRGVDLGPAQGNKRDIGPELPGDGDSDGCLPRARRTGQEDGPAGHPAFFYHADHDPRGLPGLGLSHHTVGHGAGLEAIQP